MLIKIYFKDSGWLDVRIYKFLMYKLLENT